MRLVLVGLLCVFTAAAQTVINGSRTILGNWDASTATSSKPAPTGTVLPATCSIGMVFIKTNEPAGENLHLCTASNVWSKIIGPPVSWGNITGTLSNQTDLQTALNGKSNTGHTHAAADVSSGTLADGRIAQSNVTQHQGALSILAGQITSGTLADGRVAASNVTQHQGALAIGAAQVTSGTLPDARVAASNVTQHQGALAIGASQVTSGTLAAARGGLGADASAFAGVVKMSSGVASAVTGLPGDCVKVDGTSGTCGTGGGGSIDEIVAGTAITTIVAGPSVTVSVDPTQAQLHYYGTGDPPTSLCDAESELGAVWHKQDALTAGDTNSDCIKTGASTVAWVPRATGDSSGLDVPASNGLTVSLGAGATVARSITGPAGKLTCTNGDGVAGNPSCAPGADIVDKTVSNTFTAGAKVILQPSAATAGLRLVCGALPSSPVAGDLACDSADGNKLKNYDGSTWVSGGGSGATPIGRQSAVIDFGSIVDMNCLETTFPFTGVTTSTVLALGAPANLPAGVTADAWVSAADTVKVQACAMVAGGANPPSGTYNVSIANYFLAGSLTHNFGAVVDGNCVVTTTALTGLVAGDALAFSPPPAFVSGLRFSARATATDTAELQVCNFHAGGTTSHDPVSGTYRFVAVK